ncbi:MAG: hypothetical protein M1820_010789, partial [Bogoriella megaspora]
MAAVPPPFVTLKAAVPEDISALASIHVAAFTNDQAIQIMLPDPEVHKETVMKMLAQQISDPSWLIIKAVEIRTDNITGWASWLKVGYEDAKEGDRAQESPHVSDEPLDKKSFKDLRCYTSAHQRRALGQWMSGKRCLKLNSFFTDPQFQRRGVGTMLLRWGTDLADCDGVPCYLSSTPAGYAVYHANGFRVRESLDVDLREWGPQGNDTNGDE